MTLNTSYLGVRDVLHGQLHHRKTAIPVTAQQYSVFNSKPFCILPFFNSHILNTVSPRKTLLSTKTTYNFFFSCTMVNISELTESFGSTLPQTLQARKETQFIHKMNYILMLYSILGDINVEHQHYT